MDIVTILVVLQIILSLILIIVVLLQHGTQTGLSGSIAGGAETFFGKNKGRTIDAKLKKWTSFVAILFLVSSIALSFSIKQPAKTDPSGMDLPMTTESMGEGMPDVQLEGDEVDLEANPEEVNPEETSEESTENSPAAPAE